MIFEQLEPTTGIEPVDLFLTKEALYRLSYVGHKLRRLGESPFEKIKISAFLFGAGDEIRTRDIQLGRLKLYQLSYSRPVIRQFVFLKRNDQFESKFAPTITEIRSMQEVM
jgi:hypothetical protein